MGNDSLTEASASSVDRFQLRFRTRIILITAWIYLNCVFRELQANRVFRRLSYRLVYTLSEFYENYEKVPEFPIDI